MRDTRSATQILFSFLPQETADIRGRIWRVEKWLDPVPMQVDVGGVRKRLISVIDPWRQNHTDAWASQELYEGHALEVVGLNKERGVQVERWPNLWKCTRCGRLTAGKPSACQCGGRHWGQFHFVGFHDCGYLTEPWVPGCATHGQVAVNTPGSSNVRDLVFSCPVCKAVIQRGLGAGRPCPGCGKRDPGLAFNVHRAASVYTPHTFTMVNPPRPDQLRDLLAQGGPSRCLDWVLDGMPGARPSAQGQSRQTFVEGLVAQGVPQVAADAAADAMAAKGHLFGGESSQDLHLSGEALERARDDALDIAVAVHDGRRAASSLKDEEVGPELSRLYSETYPARLHRAGLIEVDLVDRFPVLRGVFGYSRGGGAAGEKRLVMFRGRAGAYRVYADSSETEALFLRLDPVRVAKWLQLRGHVDEAPEDPSAARAKVLSALTIPARGEEVDVQTPGSATLTLLHSYVHRMIRQLAVMAGIDRESLAEYLVPRHLGAFIYAGSRGDFVLGGLQSVFETDLHHLLDRHTDGDIRCPLDPGCSRGAGACLACLHLGEPSCTHYNRFLDRGVLFGTKGYLSMEA